MRARPNGFTLVEIMMATAILGILVVAGFPKVSAGLARSNVTSARTALANMVAKARAAALQTNRLTWLKIENNNALILARPRVQPGAGNADTMGAVEPLGESYGVEVTGTVDSVRFDPRGLGTGFGATATFLVSKGGHTETVVIDGLGRVSR
ncbi:MAG TPA: GspH/FimT family pseudopilin [Gemmatimonadales bacterium]|nr:GspH/FimT family pseudopilin [Gemmatimonadales bacterium]